MSRSEKWMMVIVAMCAVVTWGCVASEFKTGHPFHPEVLASAVALTAMLIVMYHQSK